MLGSSAVRAAAGALALFVGLPAVASAAPGWLPVVPISPTSGPSWYLPTRAVSSPGGTTILGWRDATGVRVAVRTPAGQFVTMPLSRGGADFMPPELAIARDGTAVAAWPQKGTDAKWRVVAAVRAPEGSWGEPETLSSPTDTTPEPAVAIGDNDDSWVIWDRQTASKPVIEGARRPPGAGWGGSETLSATDVTASDPRIVMDPAGNATAAWISVTSGDNPVKTLSTALRPVGGVWSLPEQPSDSVTEASLPQLAVGTQGRVALVWRRLKLTLNETRVSVRDPGGAWSDSALIGEAGNYPNDQPVIAVDGRGGVAAAWSTGSKLALTSRPSAGPWVSPTLLSLPSYSDAFFPRMNAGPGSSAVVAWWAGGGPNGTSALARVRDPEGNWGLTQDLAGEPSSAPATAMDDQGNAFLFWVVVGGGLKGRAYDASGPDVTAPVATDLVAGSPGELLVDASDRWSPLGAVTWDFGDGATGTGKRVSHAYGTPGTYRVTVTAADTLGSTTTRAADVAVAAPTAEPTPIPAAATPTPVPTASPTPPGPRVTTRKPSKNRAIRFSRGYVTPGVSPKKACRGKVTLTLKAGKTILARKSTTLDRRCRYAATFTVRRSVLEKRASVTVIVHFAGNRYLGATTNSFTIRLTGD